jgi:hypothetical protein
MIHLDLLGSNNLVFLTYKHVKTLARTENKCFDILNVKKHQIVDFPGCPRSSTIIKFYAKCIKTWKYRFKWWILLVSPWKQAKSQLSL